MVESLLPHFQITGSLGSLPVSAMWSDNCLTADPELIVLGEQLVLEGVIFAEGSIAVAAGFGTPVAAFLTLGRCFDQITRATITLPPDHA